ncbi:glycosyltransferase family 4 protein [Litoreibacter roseus]|uniref:Glycosyl transferase n=1 Tax=Litoreibacter roseus TaxID=2601869 RepID=A0A6N6JFH5_9RHOB|nr:glycosyltransferase family 4 protein [Litoreibacter roseus]GFE64895.1 glycosyl transferase [Litoreibacter roseus]
MTRVLMYSPTRRADKGGVQRMMDDLERMLPDHDLSVRRMGPDETEETEGIAFHPTADATDEGTPTLAAIPKAASSAVNLAQVLRRERPDVVNIHFPTGVMSYFMGMRPFFKFKLLVSIHGGDVLRPTPQMKVHLPRFLRAADAITAVSQELAQTAQDYAPAIAPKLHYIPNGADADFWRPVDVPVIPGRIVSVGRLLTIKGFDLLIEAMKALPNAVAHIYGEGDERTKLQSQIDAAGLNARVVLKGHVSPDQLRTALSEAEVFAMPSRGEGMPLALIEALACGCPAVATDVGGIPDVLTQDAGRVVPRENVPALADALSEALSGAAHYTRQGARARAEAFSHTACYDQYAQLIHSLAARDQRGHAAE